jgi:GntR family transcriptional regulator
VIPHGIYLRGMELDVDGIVPLWEQLAVVLRGRIERGEIPPGRAIPSKRSLVQEFGISPTTVDRATGALKGEGLLVTVIGKGLFVRP